VQLEGSSSLGGGGAGASDQFTKDRDAIRFDAAIRSRTAGARS
jgi:hypothetical protein